MLGALGQAREILHESELEGAGDPWADLNMLLGRATREFRNSAPCRRGRRRILKEMNPARAENRRYLPTSPFKPPPPAPPAEQFAVEDQVTHDKYGLGRVVMVDDETAVVVDFGAQQVRLVMPCAKLSKL